MPALPETALYPPLKRYLEAQGYAVKGEVGACDLVAVRGDEEPLIVEIKRQLSLDLLLQAVERQKLSDKVYVAVPGGGVLRRRYRSVLRLCRMLGLGLIVVRPDDDAENGVGLVEPHLDPGPYKPRQVKGRKERLLREFARRVGDPNSGGSTRRPIVTAYRQDALRCARQMSEAGSLSPAKLRDQSGVTRAQTILQRNVYGWFERVSRGVYTLSPKGEEALTLYADALADLTVPKGLAPTGADRKPKRRAKPSAVQRARRTG